MRTRTVLDSAIGAGTLPGALLRTSVAQQSIAFTDQEVANTLRSVVSVNCFEDQLAREHLLLVHHAVAEVVARVPRHVFRDDLTSAGMAGLAHAARHFDPGRGVRFDQYAAHRIRGALLDELRHGDWASRSVRRHAREAQDAAEMLTMRFGRVPTTVEVAVQLGSSQRVVEKLNKDVHRALVLNYDALVVEGSADDVLPMESRSLDAVLIDRESQAYLVDAVATLPERLRRVIVGLFFEERSTHQLAEEFGVTDSRISQIRTEALGLLREGINSQLEPDAEQKVAISQHVASRRAAYHDAIACRTDAKTRISVDASLGSLLA